MARPSGPSVLSASRVMAAGTVVSRITGLLRAVLLAAAIGVVGAHPDIFNVANTIPNSLYILVAGGIFNAVLVPQLVRAIKNDPDGGDAYANRIITLGALVLTGVTVVLVVLAPQLLRLLASSYFTDPALTQERASLIAFTRWCLPQIFFYGMFVLIGQILNARGSFGPMMWTPIANNVISIALLAGYILAYPEPGSGGYRTSQEVLLGLGSTVGIAAQLLLLLPYLRAAGFTIRPRLDLRGTGLGRTLTLAKWTAGFVVVNQIAFYVMVHQATAATAQTAGAAGYSVYANAFLLTQVPHSVVTVSLATATVPLVSALAADGRLADLGRELGSSLRLVLAVIVPVATALAVLGPPLATVMFGWGAGSGDTTSLGTTMVAFAPGMLFFSVHYMLLRGFYAIEDNRTAFFVQCGVAAVNIVLAVVLTDLASPLRAAPALALAYGAAYLVGAVLSLRLLSIRLGGIDAAELSRFAVRLVTAAVPAGVASYAVVRVLGGIGLDDDRRLDALVLLLAGGSAAAATYLLVARLLNLSEVESILSTLGFRRIGAAASHGRTAARLTMESRQQTDSGDSTTAGEDRRGDVATHSVEPGTVLAERYVVEDMLAEDGDATTWRARDKVLSRSVVLQVIPSTSPAAAEMLTAAKQASRVADARIIQVLDAVDDGTLSFVVREWTNGQSLDVVLSEGPMSARKATFVMREVAGAISTAHRMGLRHRRLAPDTVVLTKSSGVKVLGLGTLAAARGGGGEQEDPELADTRDLGRLLYATLTARWPGGPSGALPAAPTEHGKVLRPRQVRAGVPRPLDVLCDRILGDPPRSGASITTVDEVKQGLSAILVNDGFAEGSAARLATSPGAEVIEPPPAVLSRPETRPGTTDPVPSTPIPLRLDPEPPPSSLRRTLLWSVVAVLAAGLLLLSYLIVRTLGGSGEATPSYATSPAPGQGGTSTGSSTPPASSLDPIDVVDATSFDPPPDGNGDENEAMAPLAIDGDPTTTWNTLVYYGAPTFGVKPGVGLVLDLGAATDVERVVVTLQGAPTTLEVRAAPANATVAPTVSVDDYRLLDTMTATGTTATTVLDEPVHTRFLLVWLTSVPAVTGGFEGRVAEIQVLG